MARRDPSRSWGKGVPMSERGPRRTYRPDTRIPTVYDAHQSGIVTSQRTHALLTVYDVEDPRPLLQAWTEQAERFMREVGGTVTFGLGAAPLPPFDGDALDPARCGGATSTSMTPGGAFPKRTRSA